MFDTWQALKAWLKLPDADWLVDGMLDGTLPVYDVDGVLDDFSIPATKANRNRLYQECDACTVESWQRHSALAA